MKKTSAGECEPSVTIWSASTSSSSLRRLTEMPVCLSNAVTSDSVVCTCWPLYTVRLPAAPPEPGLWAQPASTSAPSPAATAADSGAPRRTIAPTTSVCLPSSTSALHPPRKLGLT